MPARPHSRPRLPRQTSPCPGRGEIECKEDKVFAQLNEKLSERNIPFSVIFEVTYRCNLNCRHCYIVPEKREELNLGEIIQILEQLAEAGTLFVTFTGGEPLARPDFLEMSFFARKYHFGFRLFTNGTLIDEEIADRLVKLYPLEVAMSLYSSQAATHDYITATVGSWEKTVKAFKLLRQREIPTVMKVPLMKQNVAEYSQLIDLAGELGAKYKFDLTISPKNNGSKTPLEFRVPAEDLEGVFKDERVYPKPKVLSSRLNPSPRLCDAGKTFCGISPYGDVYPCIQLLIKSGNLRERPFNEIWHNSPELLSLRKIKSEDLKVCNTCELVSWCGRCPGLAFLEDGDILGPSTRACELTKTKVGTLFA